jgi:ribose-phosphate pyrophosphokinase
VIYSINFPEDKTKKFEVINYPAGESQVRIVPSELKKIEAADTILVTARTANGEGLIQLALLTDALNSVNTQARYILALPYIPYGRADRRFVDGDCFGLKVFGELIDALAYNTVVTFDAHSSKAKRYISNLINISPISVIKGLMERLKTQHRAYPAIILPDKGALDRLGELTEIGSPYHVYTCTKKRDVQTGKLLGFDVPKISEPYALIVDDICDGGGTFIGIAGEIPETTQLYLFVSHGIFSQGTKKFFPRFKDIFTTDSFVPKTDEGWLVLTIFIGGIIRQEVFGSTAKVFEEATSL